MLDTKLIFLDGLPGAGKSTQGQWLEAELKTLGFQAKWHPEAERDHPINFFDHFVENFDFAPYFTNIAPHIDVSLNNWRSFAASTKISPEIQILENMPYLNTMGFFLQANVTHKQLHDYAAKLREIVQALNPVLIYFHQADAHQALRRILEIRSEEFKTELFYNMGRFPFCRELKLRDFACVSNLWKEHIELMQQILPSFTSQYLEIDIIKSEWSSTREQIRKFLQLDPNHKENLG